MTPVNDLNKFVIQIRANLTFVIPTEAKRSGGIRSFSDARFESAG